MNIADILDRAADLIEPEGAWTQGQDARSAKGRTCDVSSPRARCWCAGGAILRVTRPMGADCMKATRFVEVVLGVDWVHVWNDEKGRTQAEVVAKLREAAAKARGDS